MNFMSKAIVWVIVFISVLVWRFPYATVLRSATDKLAESSGVIISWDTAEVGLLGAELKKLKVTTSTGFKFTADKAQIRTGLTNFSANFVQTGFEDSAATAATTAPSALNASKAGTASLSFKGGSLLFDSDNLLVDTGNANLKQMRVSGSLEYRPLSGIGKGELNLKVPELSGALPLPLKQLEIGDTITISKDASTPTSAPSPENKEDGQADATQSLAPSTAGSKVNNKITLFGEGFTGDGNLDMTTHPQGASPSLEGSLNVKTTSFGNHVVKIEGTWAKPTFNLAGAKL